MIEYIAPPREASPQRLLKLCDTLKDQTLEKEELVDQVSGGEDAIYDTIRYGERLGFLYVDDSTVKTTFLGKAVVSDSGMSEEEVFRTGLALYTMYIDLLISTVDVRALPAGVNRDDIIEVLEDEFGLEMSNKTMRERANTFLRTLEQAGLGTFKQATPNRPTGFAFDAGAGPVLEGIVASSAIGLVNQTQGRTVRTGPANLQAPLKQSSQNTVDTRQQRLISEDNEPEWSTESEGDSSGDPADTDEDDDDEDMPELFG